MSQSLRVITSPSGARFTVAAEHADRFQALVNDLEARGYPIKGDQSGGYNPRNIAGTNTPSLHSFGKAIDINWHENARGKPGAIPQDVALELAQKHGLTWGGAWKNRDDMHFEVADTAPRPMAQRSLVAAAGLANPAAPSAPAPAQNATPAPSYGLLADALGTDAKEPTSFMGGLLGGLAKAATSEPEAPAAQPVQFAQMEMPKPQADLSRLAQAVRQRRLGVRGMA